MAGVCIELTTIRSETAGLTLRFRPTVNKNPQGWFVSLRSALPVHDNSYRIAPNSPVSSAWHFGRCVSP